MGGVTGTGSAPALAGFTVATASGQVGLAGLLGRRGADVLAGQPDEVLDGVLAGTVDAVAFTDAAGVAALLDRAGERGLRVELVKRLSSDVLAVCTDAGTAAELGRHRVPTAHPGHHRPDALVGALVRLLEAALQSRARRIEVAGHELEIRGHAVLVDGRLRPVPPSGMALLRVMGNRPGVVVPRQALLRALPAGARGAAGVRGPAGVHGAAGLRGAGDEHAVEVAVARLRGALGEPRLIQTVVKRGYRLATDPRAGSRPRRLAPTLRHDLRGETGGEPRGETGGRAGQGRTVADRGRSAEEPPARIV